MLGFSEIAVNYCSHADSAADRTQHNAHTFGVVSLIVPHSNVFFVLALQKQEELIVHISSVRDMQMETVANGISTISSLVSAGVAKH